ncbi:MAG TPA: AAA family ATPase [Fimbriimonadaceae bacterium]|nr:AAA family ATPase [Fimbriimonadaceae bacterium]
MTPETEGRITRLLEKMEEASPNDQRIASLVAALRSELKNERADQEERDKTLAAYEEAYQKLTAPANKVGVYLRELDGDKVLVALGDTEYVALVDPQMDRSVLVAGARVMLNDAYAVIGTLPTGPVGAVIKVNDAMEDGRLRVGADIQGAQGRVIERSEELKQTKIQPGDEVRLDQTGRVAIEHFPRQETKDYFVEEVPDTPWTAVGGQERAISLIRETIEMPMLHPEIYAKFEKKPVKGILLYGPPGCGKTLIGKAIAYNLAKDYSEQAGHEVKEYFMHISGPKILNMWLGETERMVREIFATAREKSKEGRLVVIFMDEAESVLRTRSTGRWLNISNTVVPQFCAELDGLVSLENVVLILTSNRPDYIDPAILRPERIDRKVKIDRPNKDATRDILSLYLHERLPFDPQLVKEHEEPECARIALVESTLAHLWRKAPQTEFLKVAFRNGNSETLYWNDLVSGALIKSVVDRAKDTAIRRAVAEPSVEHGISEQDMREAVEAEYAENEIFPKSDAVADWLKLLDFEPESVVSVKPVGPDKGEVYVRNRVI